MPDRMLENMLNRILKDLLIKKYINIMVGILRNKLIILFYN